MVHQMLELTNSAIKHILKETHEMLDPAIRVGIKSGGCSGFQYILEPCNKEPEKLDEIIDIVLEHTHPTGTGPSGPPMPPATAKLSLLKSLRVGGSFE